MATFTIVIIIIIGGITGLAAATAALCGFIFIGPDGLITEVHWKWSILTHIAGIVILALVITGGINSGIIHDECGPGTHSTNNGGLIKIGNTYVPTTHCVPDN